MCVYGFRTLRKYPTSIKVGKGGMDNIQARFFLPFILTRAHTYTHLYTRTHTHNNIHAHMRSVCKHDCCDVQSPRFCPFFFTCSLCVHFVQSERACRTCGVRGERQTACHVHARSHICPSWRRPGCLARLRCTRSFGLV